MPPIKKQHISTKEGETDSYKWVSEAEFIAFIHTKEVIDTQKTRYLAFFKQKEYIHKSKASSNDDALLFI